MGVGGYLSAQAERELESDKLPFTLSTSLIVTDVAQRTTTATSSEQLDSV